MKKCNVQYCLSIFSATIYFWLFLWSLYMYHKIFNMQKFYISCYIPTEKFINCQTWFKPIKMLTAIDFLPNLQKKKKLILYTNNSLWLQCTWKIANLWNQAMVLYYAFCRFGQLIIVVKFMPEEVLQKTCQLEKNGFMFQVNHWVLS